MLSMRSADPGEIIISSCQKCPIILSNKLITFRTIAWAVGSRAPGCSRLTNTS